MKIKDNFSKDLVKYIFKSLKDGKHITTQAKIKMFVRDSGYIWKLKKVLYDTLLYDVDPMHNE